MWTTIALAMTLAGTPGESGQLRLSNIRPTHGLLGSERPDSRLLPGDVFFVTFDIDGLKVDDSGAMLYTMSMEVRNNTTNKIEYKSEPQDLDLPHSAQYLCRLFAQALEEIFQTSPGA